MKFLCVGYPKTGSKSCSSALRKLGYNVADFVETAEFLSSVWLDYLEDRASINDVLDAYKKHGFDSNQDVPGNVRWEELYRAMPKDTKAWVTTFSFIFYKDYSLRALRHFILTRGRYGYQMVSIA